MRWKTYRRWLFQILKTIKAMATEMPQTETVLMHTNNDNDTVRSTRRTIVRSCGICNHIEKFISIQFCINLLAGIEHSNLLLLIIFTLVGWLLRNATVLKVRNIPNAQDAIANWKICAHWFQIISTNHFPGKNKNIYAWQNVCEDREKFSLENGSKIYVNCIYWSERSVCWKCVDYR